MNSDCVKERILGMKVLYFTATGNSLAVAKRIGGELISIPRAMHDGDLSFADDAVGLVFPVYARPRSERGTCLRWAPTG